MVTKSIFQLPYDRSDGLSKFSTYVDTIKQCVFCYQQMFYEYEYIFRIFHQYIDGHLYTNIVKALQQSVKFILENMWLRKFQQTLVSKVICNVMKFTNAQEMATRDSAIPINRRAKQKCAHTCINTKYRFIKVLIKSKIFSIQER